MVQTSSVEGNLGKWTARPYYDIMNQWTRNTKVFDGLESRLYIHATFRSLPYRKAYVEEYSRRYELGADMEKTLLVREIEAQEAYNEFFIAAYTPSAEWNDFEKAGSIWKLYLSDRSGARLEPLEIKKVDSKDPLYREFFPYLDPWSYGYIVRFPRYDSEGRGPVGDRDSGFLRLVVTGLKGRGELVWRLDDEAPHGTVVEGTNP
ncbi:MAG: hypothetical protein HY890_08755 [Deltaproteobacteria bacterium]|nr:hypothetical protein [Deltaproteobacteria bacterium]